MKGLNVGTRHAILYFGGGETQIAIQWRRRVTFDRENARFGTTEGGGETHCSSSLNKVNGDVYQSLKDTRASAHTNATRHQSIGEYQRFRRPQQDLRASAYTNATRHPARINARRGFDAHLHQQNPTAPNKILSTVGWVGGDKQKSLALVWRRPEKHPG